MEKLSIKKGDNSMSKGKKTMACYGAVLIACILFLIWVLIGHSHANDRLNFDNTNVLSTELQKEGRVQIYSSVLPETFEIGQSVMFKSTHAAVEVWLDDILVYTYATEKQDIGKSPGPYWHVVSLPAESEGRELAIRMTSVYNSIYGSDQDIHYGSRGDCILRLVGNFLPVLIINCVILMMGLISLLLFVSAGKRKEMRTGAGFLWIGIFALLIAFWSLRQCGFLQFLIPSGEFGYFVDVYTLFLMVPSLDLFVYSISRTKWKKGALWVVPVYLVGVVIGTVLQLAGVMDAFEMLRVLHVLMALNALYMFWVVYRECREYKGSVASRLRVPLYTMIAFGVLELVSYYFPMVGEVSIFLPLGAMVFILMLIWQQVEEYYRILEEQKLLFYEKLANTDMLTGALNRNAYENMLKHLASEEVQLAGYGIVLFDLNSLKQINDHYGHEKGDEAIKRCHDLILTAFGDKGNCYRIGGDEFLLLVSGEKDIEQKMVYFDELVAQNQERLDFPFSVALGYAAFDAEQDRDLNNTIRRSDAMMYKDKKKKKQVQHESKAGKK